MPLKQSREIQIIKETEENDLAALRTPMDNIRAKSVLKEIGRKRLSGNTDKSITSFLHSKIKLDSL
jgi:hypothetical protein